MKANDDSAHAWIEGELRLAGMLDNRMIELLKAIDQSGSINQAAKQVGLSYKGAWQMLERANNGAPQALLATAIGGSKGGGTVLTPAGRALLALFDRLAGQHRAFIADLNRRISGDLDTVLLLQRLVLKTSTRNQLFGRIAAIERYGLDAQMTVQLKGGNAVVAFFPTAVLDGMAAGVGDDAVLLLNSADIVLAADDAVDGLSARNRLLGSVMRIQHDPVDSEVIVLLPSGEILAAMVTSLSVKKLALAPGKPVWVVFKSNAPTIGVKPL